MGGFANTVFSLLLGWLRTVASLVWSGLADPKGSSLFVWIGDHWIVIAAVLCVVGAAADLAVYLFRWKPLTVWKSYFRRKRMKPAAAAAEAPAAPEGKTEEEAEGAAPAERVLLFASNREDFIKGCGAKDLEDAYLRRLHAV